jgi:hypothetical protein
VSVGVAAIVLVAATAAPTAVSPAVKLAADSTALLVCGTTCPTFDDANVGIVMDQFITPTHQGQTITPVAVTTPEEYWPVTGLLRLVELAIGDPRLGGLGGPAWPDEPWWKLSGLFDLTIDKSIQAGVVDLESAMSKYGNDHLVIYGYSQGAAVVVQVKRKLAEQYPAGTAAPDIDFVLGGDTNLPNGGLNARFPGLYIPILDLTFNGPEPTDTAFHTDVITRQYDGAADFPLYPINVVADLNAVLGFLYLHTRPFDVSLADDAQAPAVSTDPSGKNTYYFFHTQDLPLFAPLRQLGVPEPLIDVVEPLFRAIVDMGYDRSIQPWEPTPARLIPPLNPVNATADLLNAFGEGINNAAKVFGLAPPPHDPSPAMTENITAPTSKKQTTTTVESSSNKEIDSDDSTTIKSTEDIKDSTSKEQTTNIVESISSGQAGTDESTSDEQTIGTDNSISREERGTSNSDDGDADEAGATDTADHSAADSPSASSSSVGGSSGDEGPGATKE